MLNAVITKGIEPARWLVLIGIAYTLATIIWTFFATPVAPTPVAAGPSQKSQGQQQPRQTSNVNWILSKHLFGEAGAAPSNTEIQSNEPAVPTKLQLELQAVFVADVAEDSAAIVAQRGKPGQHYRVGDKLPGNATLIEVEADRVFLRRAGVRETLAFPRLKFSAVEETGQEASSTTSRTSGNVAGARPRPASNRTTQDTRSSGTASADTTTQDIDPEAVLDEYQEKLEQDAAGTLNELGLSAADGGGYTLGNSAQSSYLQRTGLQPGDRIMSVNGRPVGDVAQDRLELGNVLAQGSARIEVMRGERRFFVTVSLKDTLN